METEPTNTESRPQTDATIETYQSETDRPLSEAVIDAIASDSEFDAIELADEFGPLYEAIDPSALDSLFHTAEGTGRSIGCVTFEYAGYRVTVDQTGQVTLADR